MKKLMFCLSLFVILSCASRKALLIQDIEDPPASDLIITSIRIVDNRESVTDRMLNIPTFSWPGQHDKISPLFTETHKKLVEDEIRKHMNGTGVKVDVIVYIENAFKEFKANWMGEHERTEVQLKIHFLDGLHTPYLISAFGHAVYEVSSWDASHEFTEELYQNAIRACIKKALREVSSTLEGMTVPNGTPDIRRHDT